MIDVEKVNNSIQELETNIGKIKLIGDLAAEVKNASDQLIKHEQKSQEMLTKLDTTEKAILVHHQEYSERLESIEKTIRQQEAQFVQQIVDMRTENKKIILEFEDTINVKLQRMKSDIDIEIRARIKDIEDVVKRENKDTLETIMQVKKDLMSTFGEQHNHSLKLIKTAIMITGANLLVTAGGLIYLIVK